MGQPTRSVRRCSLLSALQSTHISNTTHCTKAQWTRGTINNIQRGLVNTSGTGTWWCGQTWLQGDLSRRRPQVSSATGHTEVRHFPRPTQWLNVSTGDSDDKSASRICTNSLVI